MSLLDKASAAALSGDAGEAVARLEALANVPMTLALLAKSRCGFVAARLAKDADERVAAPARALVAAWKLAAKAAGAKAAPAKVEVHSAEPAPEPKNTPVEQFVASRQPASAIASLQPPVRARVAGKFRDLLLSALREGEGGGAGLLTASEAVAFEAEASAKDEAAVSSTSPPSSSTPNDPAATAQPVSNAPSRRMTEAAASSCAEDAALALEAALHATTRLAARPDAAYAEQFRTLALGLHDNRALALNVARGLHEPAAVAALSADALVSDEARASAAAMRSAYEESIQLDWKAKNRKGIMAGLGYNVDEGMLRCSKCKSRNTDFYEKQTRSADEPTTKFAQCYNCGARWRFC